MKAFLSLTYTSKGVPYSLSLLTYPPNFLLLSVLMSVNVGP